MAFSMIIPPHHTLGSEVAQKTNIKSNVQSHAHIIKKDSRAQNKWTDASLEDTFWQLLLLFLLPQTKTPFPNEETFFKCTPFKNKVLEIQSFVNFNNGSSRGLMGVAKVNEVKEGLFECFYKSEGFTTHEFRKLYQLTMLLSGEI